SSISQTCRWFLFDTLKIARFTAILLTTVKLTIFLSLSFAHIFLISKMQLQLLNFETIHFGKCGTDTSGNKYKMVTIDIDQISPATALWDDANPTVKNKLFDYLNSMTLNEENPCRLYVTFTVFDPSAKLMNVSINGNALEGLQNIFGLEHKITLQLSISQIFRDVGEKAPCGWCTSGFSSIKSEEMLLEPVPYGGFGCADDDVKFPKSLRKDWFDDNINLTGKLYITVIADSFVGEIVPDKLLVNRKILNELKDGTGADLVVVAGNGKAFNCHRSFLSAHSPVLDVMLKGNFKENRENRIEMSDMSEDSVQAFLAYVYCWETFEASENPAIAYELLKTSHKYEINNLESCMINLILSKPIKWLQVDVAIELFFFSRCLKSWANVTSRAINAINAQTKNLEKSAYFQNLFNNDPTAAMQLCIAISSSK
ncbi:BTB/POZ domain-containing protein, partial [Orchesella cincta]